MLLSFYIWPIKLFFMGLRSHRIFFYAFVIIALLCEQEGDARRGKRCRSPPPPKDCTVSGESVNLFFFLIGGCKLIQFFLLFLHLFLGNITIVVENVNVALLFSSCSRYSNTFVRTDLRI